LKRKLSERTGKDAEGGVGRPRSTLAMKEVGDGEQTKLGNQKSSSSGMGGLLGGEARKARGNGETRCKPKRVA